MPEPKDEKLVAGAMPQRKDAFHQLCQYWEVSDADAPTYRDIFENSEEGIYNYPGIVFLTDSTFLENPRAEMRYGKFSLNGRQIAATFDDGQKSLYLIQERSRETMILKRVEKDHTTVLYLKASEVFWTDATTNPYNKVNSEWRMPPKKTESHEQLKHRLKGCLQFYQYFFEGNAKSESDEIDFLGLPSCFRWYHGGIFVQGPAKLDRKWMKCFYSDEQALAARKMMEDAMKKHYDWDTTEKNWVKQIVPVLKQVKNNL